MRYGIFIERYLREQAAGNWAPAASSLCQCLPVLLHHPAGFQSPLHSRDVLGISTGCAAILQITKSELMTTVAGQGVFPGLALQAHHESARRAM